MTATHLSLQLADIAQSKSDSFVDGPFGSNLKTSDFVSTGIPLVRVQHIGVGIFKDGFDQFVTSSKFHELSRHSARSGDIVFAKMGDPIGRSALIPPGVDQALIVADCVRLRVDESKANKQYVTWILNSEPMLDQIARRGKGATRQRVNLSDFKTVQIPLPPLSDQERIVRILDEVEALRRLRAQADERCSKLVSALFDEMFGDPEDGWRNDKFGNVGSLDRGRSQHRPRDESALFGGSYPFIQTGDVANSAGRITTFTQTYSERGLAQSRLWPAGTLCITIAANIARTGILGFDACFPDSVVGFIPGDRVAVEYVQAWLQTIQKALEHEAPQAAQKNINLKTLRELDLIVPSLGLQRTFAARIGKIHQLEAAQAASRQRLDDLFQSLLHRAFQGEL